MRGSAIAPFLRDSRMHHLALGAAVVGALAVGIVGTTSSVRAGDAGGTGLSKGEKCTPFDVHDVTGPNRGKALCYV